MHALLITFCLRVPFLVLLIGVVSITQAQASEPSQPIIWYKFNEGQGISIRNSGSLNSNLNATVYTNNGNPKWTKGVDEGALSIDGKGEYVRANSELTITGNFTYSAWVNVPSKWINQYPSVIGLRNNPDQDTADLIVRHRGVSDKAHFQIRVGRKYFEANSKEKLAPGWHYLTAVYSQASTAKIHLFIDGEIQDTQAGPETINLSSTLYVGKINDSEDANSLLNGGIDEVKIYDVALNEVDIHIEYTSHKPKVNSYTVVLGDNLWIIAEKLFGNGDKWKDIATLNSLINPRIIHPGNQLVIE